MRIKSVLFLVPFFVLLYAGAVFAAGLQGFPFQRPGRQRPPEKVGGSGQPNSPAVSNSASTIAPGALAWGDNPQMAGAIEAPAVITPEVAAPVELSSSDINRLVCPEAIKDVIYSQEKGVTVKIEGRNAFIKFLVKKDGSETDYSTTPTELYVICGGKTFNLIALPKRIPSRTVMLAGGDRKARKNISFFEGMPFETKVLNILKSVYTDNIPDSFTVKERNRPFNLYKGLRLTLVRIVRVDGEGLRVKEFDARAVEADQSAMELSEKDFLKPELTANPVAIAIDKLRLVPGDTARVIIVERADQGGQFHADQAAGQPAEGGD